MFGISKKEWLSTFLKLEYGIPDACTFCNVIKEIDIEKLHTHFCEWKKSVVTTLTGVIAIDGKQARRTKDAKKRPLYVVSAFSHEYGLVMDQFACEEKSNEITAIPKVLEMLGINGCIITIDAQCQLVKNFENCINGLNIGIKCYSEMNPGKNDMDHAICLSSVFALLHGK